MVSTRHNTTSVLRTIEQILGIPPINLFDTSADPMFDGRGRARRIRSGR